MQFNRYLKGCEINRYADALVTQPKGSKNVNLKLFNFLNFFNKKEDKQ